MGESWPRRLHRYADRLDGRIRPALQRAPMLEAAWIAVLDAIVARQPDRAYLLKRILPALAASQPERVLFVGVRRYTKACGAFFRSVPTEFWTADIDPAAAPYGAAGRHVTADIRSLDQAFPSGFFDVVLLNGIFGWGVDDLPDMERSLVACARALRPGGLLLIGWNTDRSGDPGTLANIALFEPAAPGGLPHRKEFADVTHVYAWYQARGLP